MTYIKVNMWGMEIGRLVWESRSRRAYFMLNPDLRDKIPDIAPLLAPAGKRNFILPIYADERPLYQGLPPFIADSLPDSWGSTLFDRWVKDNKIPRNKVTPLYKLMFIGTMGMGALEYEPCAADLTHPRAVDVKSLYDMSLRILEERENMVLNSADDLTLQALLAVGTSAGGRQMKAIIAVNDRTGEIRSGQSDALAGYSYYILKFGDTSMPVAEIETAYYHMATAAGIVMEESRLLPVEGTNHFLTKRFDRKNGRKIHVQTLAAINPEAHSYEDLVATCRELSIPENEIDRIFGLMVFNVMANNTDDHNKNFAFLLAEDGKWHIAPAYDITFIFNTKGTGPNIERRFSIGGKTAGITKSDLLEFAARNDIGFPQETINRVAWAIGQFDRFAQETGIGQPWRGIILKTLNDNLIAFGYRTENSDNAISFRDKHGRTITGFSATVNAKGHYTLTAIINGIRRRRFIRPGMSLYSDLARQDINALSADEKIRITGIAFPLE